MAAAVAGYLFISLTLVNIFAIMPHYSKPLKKAINLIQDEIALQEKIHSINNNEISKIKEKYKDLSARDLLDMIEYTKQHELYKKSFLRFFNKIEIRKEACSAELQPKNN